MNKNAAVEHKPVHENSYGIFLRPYLIFFFQLHVVILVIAEKYGDVL